MTNTTICPTCKNRYRPRKWTVAEGDISTDTPAAIAESHLRGIAYTEKQHFIALYFNSRNVLICQEIISIGTLNASLVHPREVFRPAIACNALSVVVAHNHPSGNTTPSQDDVQTTERLIDVGKLVGISLLDHIIVAEDSVYSFRVNGHLEF